MERSVADETLSLQFSRIQEAWEMVLGELRAEMSRALFETWVQPLRPVSYQKGVFTLGAINTFGRAWVEERLNARIAQLLTGFYGEAVTVKVMIVNSFYHGDDALALPAVFKPIEKPSRMPREEFVPAEEDPEEPTGSPRKIMLQRAYGSQRARLIQPERGMFVTGYLFSKWLPILGHSAFTVILAARSMCYWNPMTGELRNVVETEMGEIATRAAVSVRTVKDVLNDKPVQAYFLRYRVRRVMTANGVRTAGISMQVRMDDPLTPQDQSEYGIEEDLNWYLPEFGPSERIPED
jgi:hypothetical protein